MNIPDDIEEYLENSAYRRFQEVIRCMGSGEYDMGNDLVKKWTSTFHGFKENYPEADCTLNNKSYYGCHRQEFNELMEEYIQMEGTHNEHFNLEGTCLEGMLNN